MEISPGLLTVLFSSNSPQWRPTYEPIVRTIKVAENAAEGFASPVYRYVVTNRPSSPVRLFGFPAMHVCLPHVGSGSIFWLSKWGWLPAINERQGFQECSQERIRRLYEEGKRENRIMESVSQQNTHELSSRTMEYKCKRKNTTKNSVTFSWIMASFLMPG